MSHQDFETSIGFMPPSSTSKRRQTIMSTETKLTPATPPLPVGGSSINPEWLLSKLQNFSKRLASIRTLAALGKISFEDLIWDGNSDLSSCREWAAFKYWAGVFMEGFNPVYLMELEPRSITGRSMYVGTKHFDRIKQWIDISIFMLERFIREYPGEQMRKVDLQEKAALGTMGEGFGVADLRVPDAKAITIDAGKNVDKENGDEDWVDVGDDWDGGSKLDKDWREIQKEWVLLAKGQIV